MRGYQAHPEVGDLLLIGYRVHLCSRKKFWKHTAVTVAQRCQGKSMPLNCKPENGKNHIHHRSKQLFEVMFRESYPREMITSLQLRARFPHSGRRGKAPGKLWDPLPRLWSQCLCWTLGSVALATFLCLSLPGCKMSVLLVPSARVALRINLVNQVKVISSRDPVTNCSVLATLIFV